MFSVGDQVRLRDKDWIYTVRAIQDEYIYYGDGIKLSYTGSENLINLTNMNYEERVPAKIRNNKPVDMSWKEYLTVCKKLEFYAQTKFQFLTDKDLEFYQKTPHALWYYYVKYITYFRNWDMSHLTFVDVSDYIRRGYTYNRVLLLFSQNRELYSVEELKFLHWYITNFHSAELVIVSNLPPIQMHMLNWHLYKEFEDIYNLTNALPYFADMPVMNALERYTFSPRITNRLERLEPRTLSIRTMSWKYMNQTQSDKLYILDKASQNELLYLSDYETYRNRVEPQYMLTHHGNSWVRDLIKKIPEPRPFELLCSDYCQYLYNYSDYDDLDSCL